ncbi:hypothetical protein [Acidisphaera sp. L21]|jgi:hypothetical protein|uniref:hypothetical protein n=1 Tax=Acidisphaera sp. L21 TaxID=1641851 RepID=UPI00131ADFE1|nr:hypothetical protein [Acidisphaera sp. L21]
MANSDVFAFEKSGLSPFLFAEIGTDLNGSGLTILSTLARLGADPWAEAAQWSSGSRSAAADSLAAAIVRMPLDADVIANAPAIARRLIKLLPRQNTVSDAPNSRSIKRWTAAGGGSLILVYVAVALTVVLSIGYGLMWTAPHVDTAPASESQVIIPPK